DQCAQGRDVARRPAPAVAERSGPVRMAASPASLYQARHHVPVAGERSQYGDLPPLDGNGQGIRGELVHLAGRQNSRPHAAGGFAAAWSFVIARASRPREPQLTGTMPVPLNSETTQSRNYHGYLDNCAEWFRNADAGCAK